MTGLINFQYFLVIGGKGERLCRQILAGGDLSFFTNRTRQIVVEGWVQG